MAEITIERTYYLVGHFMSNWAIAESTLNTVIAQAIDLNLTQYFLFSRVLSFKQKQNILRVLVNLNYQREEERSHFKEKVDDELTKLYKDRNLVVHTLFGPVRDGVVFNRVKYGSGEIEPLTTTWLEGDFHNRTDRLLDLTDQLEDLRKGIKAQKSHRNLVQASTGQRETTIDDIFQRLERRNTD